MKAALTLNPLRPPSTPPSTPFDWLRAHGSRLTAHGSGQASPILGEGL